MPSKNKDVSVNDPAIQAKISSSKQRDQFAEYSYGKL